MDKLFIVVLGMMFLTSCTYNISLSHVSGGSSDVSKDTATTDIEPHVNVPIIPGVG
jgi:hypothetical protein